LTHTVVMGSTVDRDKRRVRRSPPPPPPRKPTDDSTGRPSTASAGIAQHSNGACDDTPIHKVRV